MASSRLRSIITAAKTSVPVGGVRGLWSRQQCVSGGAGSTTPHERLQRSCVCQGGGGVPVFNIRSRPILDGRPIQVGRTRRKRSVGARRSAGNRLERAQTVRHHDQWGERPRDGAAGRCQRRCERCRWRGHFNPLACYHLAGNGNLTLSLSYYLAHGSNATTADFLRVSVVGTTTSVVFQRLGAAADVVAPGPRDRESQRLRRAVDTAADRSRGCGHGQPRRGRYDDVTITQQ